VVLVETTSEIDQLLRDCRCIATLKRKGGFCFYSWWSLIFSCLTRGTAIAVGRLAGMGAYCTIMHKIKICLQNINWKDCFGNICTICTWYSGAAIQKSAFSWKGVWKKWPNCYFSDIWPVCWCWRWYSLQKRFATTKTASNGISQMLSNAAVLETQLFEI